MGEQAGAKGALSERKKWKAVEREGVVRIRRVKERIGAAKHKLLLVRRRCYITSSGCSGGGGREMFWKSRGRS